MRSFVGGVLASGSCSKRPLKRLPMHARLMAWAGRMVGVCEREWPSLYVAGIYSGWITTICFLIVVRMGMNKYKIIATVDPN